MVIMTINRNEVSCSYYSHDEYDNECDDDTKAFVMKLHDNLNEFYANKNREFKIKINAFLNENSKLF